MIQWEYSVRVLPDFGTVKEQDFLSEQGAEGWELCAVNFINSVSFYYFKRPLKQ
jgi:hypothetical protein